MNAFVNSNNSIKSCNNGGTIVLLFAIILQIIFFFLAITIDLSIYFSSRYSLQAYADASSAAAVDLFSEFDTSTRTHTNLTFRYPWEGSFSGMSNAQIIENRLTSLKDDFRKSKLAPLAILKAYASEIKGLSPSVITAINQEQITFNAGNYTSNQTAPDYPQHQYDTAVSGNLAIKITRGIRCYIGPERYFCPIENDPDNWIYSNTVLINATLNLSNSFFRKLIMPGSTTIATRSISYLPEQVPPVCGVPSCGDLGTGSFSATCVPLISVY